MGAAEPCARIRADRSVGPIGAAVSAGSSAGAAAIGAAIGAALGGAEPAGSLAMSSDAIGSAAMGSDAIGAAVIGSAAGGDDRAILGAEKVLVGAAWALGVAVCG